MKKWSYLPLIIALLPLLAHADVMRIAVMDLKANTGVPAATSQAVSDLVRSEMINLQRYTIIERGQVDAILTEQGFQQSGCVETECAVQMGQLLSAQYIIVGSVAQFGTAYNINIRLVNVQEGNALAAEQVTSQSLESIPDDIKTLVERLDARLRNISPHGISSQSEREAIDEFNAQMKVIRKSIRRFRSNKEDLLSLVSSIDSGKKAQLYRLYFRNDQITGCLLNSFGLGIGSFVIGDTAAGIIMLSGIAIFAAFIATDYTTIGTSALYGALLYSYISPFIYVMQWNKILKEVLLSDVAFCENNERYAFIQPANSRKNAAFEMPVYCYRF